eukprot:748338-Hanusia_phi.AAC.6
MLKARIFYSCTKLDHTALSKSLVVTEGLVRIAGSNRKIMCKIRTEDMMSERSAEKLLGLALDAIRHFSISYPQRCEQVARDLFIDLCMDESLLSLLPLAARNRVIEQSISHLCSLINDGKETISGSSNSQQEIIELVHSVASVVFNESSESTKSSRFCSQRGGVLLLGALSSRIQHPEVGNLCSSASPLHRLRSAPTSPLPRSSRHSPMNHLQAMDIIHRLFLEGLQSLPSTLHENLLLHLTGIALVPPHKYLRSVCDPFPSLPSNSAILPFVQSSRAFLTLFPALLSKFQVARW